MSEGEAIAAALATVRPMRPGENPTAYCKRETWPVIRAASEKWWRGADAAFWASLR
jgi:hypothetical protein